MLNENKQKRKLKNKDNRHIPQEEPRVKASYENKYDPMRKNKNYWKSLYK